jgi:hypothetical protein
MKIKTLLDWLNVNKRWEAILWVLTIAYCIGCSVGMGLAAFGIVFFGIESFIIKIGFVIAFIGAGAGLIIAAVCVACIIISFYQEVIKPNA